MIDPNPRGPNESTRTRDSIELVLKDKNGKIKEIRK